MSPHLPAPALGFFLPGNPRTGVLTVQGPYGGVTWVLYTAAALNPSGAVLKFQHVPARNSHQVFPPVVSIQSSLNSAVNEVLFLLYVQVGPFFLVWKLKPFESKLLVLPMPGLLWTGTEQSFFRTATTASVGSAAPWAASRPSQHTFLFQCFPFSFRCSISFNFTQHFPLSYCWQ